jgi:hypothetical protein
LDAVSRDRVHDVAQAVMPAGVEPDAIRAWVDEAADASSSESGSSRRGRSSKKS